MLHNSKPVGDSFLIFKGKTKQNPFFLGMETHLLQWKQSSATCAIVFHHSLTSRTLDDSSVSICFSCPWLQRLFRNPGTSVLLTPKIQSQILGSEQSISEDYLRLNKTENQYSTGQNFKDNLGRFKKQKSRTVFLVVRCLLYSKYS